MNAAPSALPVSGGIRCICGEALRLSEERPGPGIGAGTELTFHAYCPRCTGRSGSPPVPEVIYWRDPERDPPDDEVTVLVHLPASDDEAVWVGYREDGRWYDAVDGGPFRVTVAGWAEMPAGRSVATP